MRVTVDLASKGDRPAGLKTRFFLEMRLPQSLKKQPEQVNSTFLVKPHVSLFIHPKGWRISFGNKSLNNWRFSNEKITYRAFLWGDVDCDRVR